MYLQDAVLAPECPEREVGRIGEGEREKEERVGDEMEKQGGGGRGSGSGSGREREGIGVVVWESCQRAPVPQSTHSLTIYLHLSVLLSRLCFGLLLSHWT